MYWNDLPRAAAHLLLVRPFMRLFIGFNARGRERLAGLKQAILVSNHSSHLDTLLILSSLDLSTALRTRVVAAADYFGGDDLLGVLTRWLFRLVTVSRRRVTRSDNPLERMSEALAQGDNLLIFPEGTRGDPERIGSYKAGVGHLATRFPDIPLVPVCVVGAGRSLPKGASVPVPMWTSVEFGEPVAGQGRPADTAAHLEEVARGMLREGILRAGGPKEAHPSGPRKPLTVAVIGIDGSGKSTCMKGVLEALCRDAPATGIGDELWLGRDGKVEAVDWVPGAAVRMTLHRLAKGAARLAHYKVFKLLELLMRSRLQDIMTLKFGPRFTVSDGHPLVNIAGWGSLARPEVFSPHACAEALEAMQPHTKLSWSRLIFFASRAPEVLLVRWLARLRLPDAAVLLKVDPEAAVARIEARGEARQMHEHAAHLRRLQDAYETVLRILAGRGVRTRVVDAGGRSADEVREEVLTMVREEGGKGGDKALVERVDVIATTISGSVKDWGKIDKLAPLFEKRFPGKVRVHVVNSHEEARAAAAKAAREGSRVLVSAGGAGTFNRVMQGTLEGAGDVGRVKLGFLRKGSADLIGKALGIPDDVEGAVRLIADGIEKDRTVACDVINVREEGGSEERNFVGFGGIEVIGDIPFFTENPWTKYYKGFLGALFGDLGPFRLGTSLAMSAWLLRRAVGRAHRFRLNVDGRPLEGDRWLSVLLINGDLGPDMPFGRGLGLGRGEFYVVTLRDIGLLRLPGQVRRSFSGAVREDPARWGFELSTVRRELRVEPVAPGRPFRVNIDGLKWSASGPVSFTLKQRLHLISGRD